MIRRKELYEVRFDIDEETFCMFRRTKSKDGLTFSELVQAIWERWKAGKMPPHSNGTFEEKVSSQSSDGLSKAF